jgi:hypothetical protein
MFDSSRLPLGPVLLQHPHFPSTVEDGRDHEASGAVLAL